MHSRSDVQWRLCIACQGVQRSPRFPSFPGTCTEATSKSARTRPWHRPKVRRRKHHVLSCEANLVDGRCWVSWPSNRTKIRNSRVRGRGSSPLYLRLAAVPRRAPRLAPPWCCGVAGSMQRAARSVQCAAGPTARGDDQRSLYALRVSRGGWWPWWPWTPSRPWRRPGS